MIKIITGDSAEFNFSIVYPGAVDGLPAPDLSEATVVFAIEQVGGKRPVKVEKSVTSPETNIVTYTFTPEETAVLPTGAYKACCKVYYGNEATTVWMENIIVIKGVLGANS